MSILQKFYRPCLKISQTEHKAKPGCKTRHLNKREMFIGVNDKMKEETNKKNERGNILKRKSTT